MILGTCITALLLKHMLAILDSFSSDAMAERSTHLPHIAVAKQCDAAVHDSAAV